MGRGKRGGGAVGARGGHGCAFVKVRSQGFPARIAGAALRGPSATSPTTRRTSGSSLGPRGRRGWCSGLGTSLRSTRGDVTIYARAYEHRR
ncbi:hypothetical protein SERN_1483 [Serinibacter arcticus]|uniref:Uncharacterized protein n=1 Tax=Serinibacter arcticus TaxID=1655435 RepID=A0A4Z1E2N0_9MICO|nr:hypothetical protein SERN_1483 [Serinibacter arcticus]